MNQCVIVGLFLSPTRCQIEYFKTFKKIYIRLDAWVQNGLQSIAVFHTEVYMHFILELGFVFLISITYKQSHSSATKFL